MNKDPIDAVGMVTFNFNVVLDTVVDRSSRCVLAGHIAGLLDAPDFCRSPETSGCHFDGLELAETAQIDARESTSQTISKLRMQIWA